MSQQDVPQLIEKEQIANFHFPHTDVLTDPAAIAKRKTDLERAATLGNIEKYKIRIIFEDDEALKAVETTVWASGEDNIVLKQGVFIPVHRIVEVKLL